MQRQLYASLAFTLGLAVACAGNDDTAITDSATGTVTPAPIGSGIGTGGMTDADIVGALTAANAAEIELSQMARDSATNAQVKSFARMIVSEHNAMNEQVHQLGRQLNITSTAGERTEDLAESSSDMAEDLRGKRGAEFDRAYMDAMVESHEKTLQLLDRAAQATNTPQLDQNLTQARTKVQQHLERAKQVRQQLR